MFAHIELRRGEHLLDKTECFGTSMKVRGESGIRISRLTDIRFEAKHEGDRKKNIYPDMMLTM